MTFSETAQAGERQAMTGYCQAEVGVQVLHSVSICIQGGCYSSLSSRVWSSMTPRGRHLWLSSWEGYWHGSPCSLYRYWHYFLPSEPIHGGHIRKSWDTRNTSKLKWKQSLPSPMVFWIVQCLILTCTLKWSENQFTVNSLHCQANTILRQVLKYANRNVKTLNLFYIHNTHNGIFIFSCGFLS